MFIQLRVSTPPRSLAWDQPVSDKELEAFCAANNAMQVERTKDGELRMNPPTGLFTSDGNSEVNRQLRNWWMTHRQGKVSDSNGGFYLADGSMLSPDAANISADRLKGLQKKQLRGFPHVCPNFVIELLSQSDSLRETQEKMRDWIANGAELAWLIDPYARQVTVYRPSMRPAKTTRKQLEGSGPVEGFALDLSEVWSCYE